MSQPNPNTHQRPDEDEPKKGKERSGKGGFMQALRAGRLAQLLGAAPLVAPTAAAAVTGAAIVGAPSIADAQEEGGDIDMEALTRALKGGEDKPAPGGGGGKKKGGGGAPAAPKTPEALSPVEKLFLQMECAKRDIKSNECTVESLAAKVTAEEGTPLTDKDFFWYQAAIWALLALAGVGIWRIRALGKRSTRMNAILSRMGVTPDMSDEAAYRQMMETLENAAAGAAAEAVANPPAGGGPAAGGAAGPAAGGP